MPKNGSVSVRFKSSKELLEIPVVSGAYISVAEVRKAIVQWKRLSSSSDYELELSNEATGHVYVTDHTLIPPETKLTVLRVPSKNPKCSSPAPAPAPQYLRSESYPGPGDSRADSAAWRRYSNSTSEDSGIDIVSEDFGSGAAFPGQMSMPMPPCPSGSQFVLNPCWNPGARDGAGLLGSGPSGNTVSNSNLRTIETVDLDLHGRYQYQYQSSCNSEPVNSRRRTISNSNCSGSGNTNNPGEPEDEHDDSLDNEIFGLSEKSKSDDLGGAKKAKRRRFSSPTGAAEDQDGSSASRSGSCSVPGPNYTCFYCGTPGHFIRDCPAKLSRLPPRHSQAKRTTGIPRTQLVIVDRPQRGSMINPEGRYVVPIVDLTIDD